MPPKRKTATPTAIAESPEQKKQKDSSPKSPASVHKIDGTNDTETLNNIRSKLAPGRSVVYTFGRFQPPTIGHGLLIENVVQIADQLGADHGIFVSKSCNDLNKYEKSTKYKNMIQTNTFESCEGNKNPLNVYQKMHYMSHMFPTVNLINTAVIYQFEPTKSVSPFDVLHYLSQQGYINIVLVLGSDRAGESKLVNSLKNTAKKIGGINMFFVSAGKERTKSDGIEGMSGTKLREYAAAGNLDAFFSGVNTGGMTRELARNMMNDVREGMLLHRLDNTQNMRGGVYFFYPHIKKSKRKTKKWFEL